MKQVIWFFSPTYAYTPLNEQEKSKYSSYIRLDAVNTTASKISHRNPPLKISPLESQG